METLSAAPTVSHANGDNEVPQVSSTAEVFSSMRQAAHVMFQQRTRDLTKTDVLQDEFAAVAAEVDSLQQLFGKLSGEQAKIDALVEEGDQKRKECATMLQELDATIVQTSTDQQLCSKFYGNVDQVTRFLVSFIQGMVHDNGVQTVYSNPSSERSTSDLRFLINACKKKLKGRSTADFYSMVEVLHRSLGTVTRYSSEMLLTGAQNPSLIGFCSSLIEQGWSEHDELSYLHENLEAFWTLPRALEESFKRKNPLRRFETDGAWKNDPLGVMIQKDAREHDSLDLSLDEGNHVCSTMSPLTFLFQWPLTAKLVCRRFPDSAAFLRFLDAMEDQLYQSDQISVDSMHSTPKGADGSFSDVFSRSTVTEESAAHYPCIDECIRRIRSIFSAMEDRVVILTQMVDSWVGKYEKSSIYIEWNDFFRMKKELEDKYEKLILVALNWLSLCYECSQHCEIQKAQKESISHFEEKISRLSVSTVSSEISEEGILSEEMEKKFVSLCTEWSIIIDAIRANPYSALLHKQEALKALHDECLSQNTSTENGEAERDNFFLSCQKELSVLQSNKSCEENRLHDAQAELKLLENHQKRWEGLKEQVNVIQQKANVVIPSGSCTDDSDLFLDEPKMEDIIFSLKLLDELLLDSNSPLMSSQEIYSSGSQSVNAVKLFEEEMAKTILSDSDFQILSHSFQEFLKGDDIVDLGTCEVSRKVVHALLSDGYHPDCTDSNPFKLFYEWLHAHKLQNFLALPASALEDALAYLVAAERNWESQKVQSDSFHLDAERKMQLLREDIMVSL